MSPIKTPKPKPIPPIFPTTPKFQQRLGSIHLLHSVKAADTHPVLRAYRTHSTALAFAKTHVQQPCHSKLIDTYDDQPTSPITVISHRPLSREENILSTSSDDDDNNQPQRLWIQKMTIFGLDANALTSAEEVHLVYVHGSKIKPSRGPGAGAMVSQERRVLEAHCHPSGAIHAMGKWESGLKSFTDLTIHALDIYK
ncbi:MAG: hypothetical protein Q9174_004229, partial [Haloplaca sp. 1 TL-2023]